MSRFTIQRVVLQKISISTSCESNFLTTSEAPHQATCCFMKEILSYLYATILLYGLLSALLSLFWIFSPNTSTFTHTLVTITLQFHCWYLLRDLFFCTIALFLYNVKEVYFSTSWLYLFISRTALPCMTAVHVVLYFFAIY